MSNNLLELLKEYLSGDVVSNIAMLMGESPQNTESALHAALPSVLSGLVSQSSDTNNVSKLFNLLNQGDHDGGILSNLGALSRGGDETNTLLSDGASLLSTLFGDKTAAISDVISSASGISKTSSTSLLGFVTPVILGLIGKNLRINNNENTTGLLGLLTAQSSFIKDFIPAGLSDILAGSSFTQTLDSVTTGNILDKASDMLDSASSAVSSGTSAITEELVNIGDEIEETAEETLASAKHIAEEIGESASEMATHIAEESKEFAHSAMGAIEEGTEGGSKFLPWFLIAAALALAWGLLKSCSTPETPPADATSTTAPAVTPPPVAEPAVVTPPPAPAAPEPAKVVEPEADKASDAFEKKLASGYVIKSAKDGLESKLVGFIEGSDPIKDDLWFTMDGITFDTSKATIKSESTVQINQIAEILKAYPKVKIKIGGYTDNTGKASANKTLSDNRANAVKKALTEKDLKADRIEAEGYGSDHPVASNDTAEGRQQNRRIDVRVIEK
jgi:outer membrane protein OmpA-like peptidoglycan-associated protein